MNKIIQLIFSVLAVMSMVISVPQMAFAYEGQLNEEYGYNSSVCRLCGDSDNGMTEKGTRPPFQWIGAVKDISGGKTYSFSGELPGILYSDYRFKGKTSYMLKMTKVTQPVTIRITKYIKADDLHNPTVASFTAYTSGAVLGFGASKTSDQFYIEFSSDYDSTFAGYVK